MRQLAKVEGRTDLVRDMKTGAILVTSPDAKRMRERVRARNAAARQQAERIDALENGLKSVEEKLDQVLEALRGR